MTWREGFEAAVIISMILAYMKRAGHTDSVKYVWFAAGLASALCLVVGTAIFTLTEGFEGRVEEIYEGVIGLLAAFVLTHVWRHGVNYRRRVEGHAEKALASDRAGLAIFAAVFIAVLIEGLEIVLFLFATFETGTVSLIVGGALGLVLAAVAGWIFYQTNRLKDAVLFFYAIGAVLIVVAAGLLAHGIHELQEAGIFPVIWADIWNLNGLPLLNEKAGFGSFLKVSIGYNGNPSLLEFLAWSGYLIIAARYFNARAFFRMIWRRTSGRVLSERNA